MLLSYRALGLGAIRACSGGGLHGRPLASIHRRCQSSLVARSPGYRCTGRGAASATEAQGTGARAIKACSGGGLHDRVIGPRRK